MTTASQPRVVVIGGGITGLATAWRLAQHGRAVTLLESGSRWGGRIATTRLAGYDVDLGADAFLARQDYVGRLVDDLGLADDLVAPVTADVRLWVGGRLRPLPTGTVMGAPTDLDAVARAGVLSDAGLRRAMAEPHLPPTLLVGDASVGDVIAARYGDEVVDVLVDPLLGGVYAGDARRISVRTAAAMIAEVASTQPSLTVGLAALRARGAAIDTPVFQTLRGGLGRVIGALVAGLDPGSARLDAAAVGLQRQGDAWQVRLADGTVVTADRVIITTPAGPAATLLDGVAPDAARTLDELEYATVGVLGLVYGRADVGHAMDGSGMLVPRTEGRLVKAATWSSSKWPHLADADHVVLRASVGRHGDTSWLQHDDATLLALVHADLAEALDIREQPIQHEVARWHDALPQYRVGHLDRVAAIRTELPPGIHVGGAAYDGVGLATCVRQSEALVEAVLD